MVVTMPIKDTSKKPAHPNGIEGQVSRIESILFGCAGFLLVSLIGIVTTMITMH
jgi:hypothetical protein